MTDFINGLEQDLVDAARRRATGDAPATAAQRSSAGLLRRRPRPPLRSVVLAAMLLVLTAGSAAGTTLLALRGSVIPAPQAVPPEQTPAPGSSRVERLRAADPQSGRLPWTLRVARSETGLLCSTVGQVSRDGRFGLVGLDGRFRTIADGVSDSCGTAHRSGASLIGARIFDASERRDVRTVVSGVVADDVRRVDIELPGRRARRVALTDGAFVVALRGYPEDLGLRVTLTLASGRRQVHDFGRSSAVALDPGGAAAWKIMAFMVSGDGRTCASFTWARTEAWAPRSPAACGDLGSARHRRGFYVAMRRMTRGPRHQRPASPFDGSWGSHAPSTAVYGGVGDDVRALMLQVGSAPARPLAIGPGRTFLAVLNAKVDPRAVTLRVRMADGRTVVARGSTNLVDKSMRSR